MNKLMRKQMETRHNKLWVGMYNGENRKAELSYRTKAEERDRLKLERECEVWEQEINTTRHTYGG